MVKVKHNKKETQRGRTTKYVNSITATEGLTQPNEFVDFTFLIAFWEWERTTRAAIHWALAHALLFLHLSPPVTVKWFCLALVSSSKWGWWILTCSSPLSWKLGRQSKAVLHRIASICQTWLWVSCHPSDACSPWAEQSYLRQWHVFLRGWLVLVERTATRVGSFCDPAQTLLALSLPFLRYTWQ